jgi:uncharacterized protein GlcG (DUF336 family)
MFKRILVSAAVGMVMAACSNPPRGETQPGAANDLNQGAPAGRAAAKCDALPSKANLLQALRRAPDVEGEAGGLFSGRSEWAALVDREGRICAVVASTDDHAATWPGSQSIAQAKAYTANAFSTDTLPLSTARLYTLTQPGHSLWGLSAGDPFNAACLAAPADAGQQTGRICGGAIAFGGGVPLYKGKTRVGGLGVSGDTACADHEIAKRIRHLTGLDPEKGEFADDITFAGADGASIYTHPLCANTWRNGRKIGEEAVAQGY